MELTDTKTRKFTVDEYSKMVEAGILRSGDRVELLDGTVVVKSPSSPYHAVAVDLLVQAFQRLGDRVAVRCQNPGRLDEYSLPEPDVMLLRAPITAYRQHHPSPDDIFLVVEASLSSRRFDLDIKVPLYARAGVREVWVIDLKERCVLVFRSPRPDGYATRLMIPAGDPVSPLDFPDLVIETGVLFAD